jgi:hypothetical protein
MNGSNNLGISGKTTNRAAKSSTYEAKPEGLDVSDIAASRTGKYSLQRTAQSLLHDHGKPAHQQHRTCWCHRGVASAADAVTVYRQTSGDSARLHGVTTCKSVWACPVCSAKICAVRQVELGEAVVTHTKQGGYTWLMTLTFPHERGMPLALLLARFTKAKTHFKNSKTYKRILGKEVRLGSASSLEVTHGVHGWHPHQHDLVFATPDAFGECSVDDASNKHTSPVIDELKAAWFTSLRKNGLCEQSQMSDVLAHGLDVRGGAKAAEYIAKFGKEQKWGLSREVTMHAAKAGGKTHGDYNGAHPFQLLAWATGGDGESAALFREYVEAFEGKRMLTWSKGLKKALTGREEISDEEAADIELPEELPVGRIDSEALAVLQSRRLLGNFLAYVATWCADPAGAQAEINAYLEWARTIPRNARGEVKVKMHSRGFMHVDQEKNAA